MAHALATPALRGAVNGTAPDPVRQGEFALALAAAVRRPLLFKAPALALRMVLGEMAVTLLQGQRTDGKKLAASGYTFLYPRIGLALGNITAGGGRGKKNDGGSV
jgi:NAD dependent epimerase/dehydratase family enzyme